MESKRKIRKVRKAVKAQAEPPKPPKDKLSPEVLIRENGELVEQLFLSKPWVDIAFPLLQESIAGVSGRFTNGRYYHGDLTTKWREEPIPLFVAGYQKALMDFYNNLQDFIQKRDEVIAKNKQEAQEFNAPFINPMTEEFNEEA